MTIAKRRRDFGGVCKLADKDAHELWNSSQMECRPFKDPNFDMRKMEQEVAVTCIRPTLETAVQVGLKICVQFFSCPGDC